MKSIAEASPESRLLFAFLIKAKVNEIFTYDQLSKVIGRDIRKHRGAIYTAKRMALREHNMVFNAVRKVGIKRLASDGMSEAGMGAIESIRRKSVRTGRMLSCANVEELTNGARIRHNTVASIVGVLALVTKPSAVKRLEATVEKKQSEIPTAETMKLFSE